MVSLLVTGQPYHPRLGSGLSSGQFHRRTGQIDNLSVHVAPGLLPRAVQVPHSVQNRLPVLQQNHDLESVIGSWSAGHLFDRLPRGPRLCKYIAPEILPLPNRIPKGVKELALARPDYDLQVACCICSATNFFDSSWSVAHLAHDVAPLVLPRCVVAAIVLAYRVV